MATATLDNLKERMNERGREIVRSLADGIEVPEAEILEVVSASDWTIDLIRREVEKIRKRREAAANLARAVELKARFDELHAKSESIRMAAPEIIKAAEDELERVKREQWNLQSDARNAASQAKRQWEELDKASREYLNKTAPDWIDAKIQSLESRKAYLHSSIKEERRMFDVSHDWPEVDQAKQREKSTAAIAAHEAAIRGINLEIEELQQQKLTA